MILVFNSTLYTAGQPFARFASNLKAALWLRSVGAVFVRRSGSGLLFRLT